MFYGIVSTLTILYYYAYSRHFLQVIAILHNLTNSESAFKVDKSSDLAYIHLIDFRYTACCEKMYH